MFSDLEFGTKVVLGVIFIALLYFGGKNVFKGGGSSGTGSGKSGTGGTV